MTQAATVFEVALDRAHRVHATKATGQFDWGLVDPETRQFIERKAELIDRLAKPAAGRLIEIGKAFCEIRERLPRGVWSLWIELESGWAPAIVYRLIQVYKTFGDVDFDAIETPTSPLYVLSHKNVPEEAKQEARQMLGSGHPVTRDVAEDLIKKHRPTSSGLLFPPRLEEVRHMQDEVNHSRMLVQQVSRTVIDYERLLDDIGYAVTNLRMALAEAYGVPIKPVSVRDALSKLEQLIAAEEVTA